MLHKESISLFALLPLCSGLPLFSILCRHSICSSAFSIFSCFHFFHSLYLSQYLTWPSTVTSLSERCTLFGRVNDSVDICHLVLPGLRGWVCRCCICVRTRGSPLHELNLSSERRAVRHSRKALLLPCWLGTLPRARLRPWNNNHVVQVCRNRNE